MRNHLFIRYLITTLVILAVPALVVTGASPATRPDDTLSNITQAPAVILFQGESPVTITPAETVVPRGARSPPSGEVEHPISHPIQPITPIPQRTPNPTIPEVQRRTPPPTVPVVRPTPERTPYPRTSQPTPLPTTPIPTQPRTTATTQVPPTPTPSPTPVVTPTPTVSATPTVSQTPTPGSTPTISPTPTVSLTSTVSQTPTVSPTPTAIIVTVTVPVYPSGSVYSPYYYYPPGYNYPIRSYYPDGILTVTSNPSGAIVTIDGYNSETTPWTFTNLLTGYHTVKVNYPGYEAYVTDVYIDSGNNQEIDADLLSLVGYGSMFIESTPSGSDVYVDGNYEGVSPVTVSGLTDGPHIVELHHTGYDVQMRTVDVLSGQGSNVNFAMNSYSQSTNVGSIDLTSNIPGAIVYLDGTYKGQVQDGNIFNIIEVSPGAHTVLVHAPMYNDFVQTIQVNPGQISSATAVLSPSSQTPQNPPSTSPQPGSMVVTSNPSGGQVFLDNQFRGDRPGNHL